MIWKKALKFFLVLIAGFLIFAILWFLYTELAKYDGQCTYGFINTYSKPCNLWAYLKNENAWYYFFLFIYGLYWTVGSIIFTLFYWFWLVHRKDRLTLNLHRRFRLYTLLGIISGIGLAAAFAISGIIHTGSLLIYFLLILITLILPVILGGLIDQSLNSQDAKR